MDRTKMLRLQQTGYTIIELLLYIAIVSGLLLAVTGFFGVSVDSRIKNRTISEVNQQATYAMDYMTQIIRNSSGFTVPLAGTSGSLATVAVPTASLSPTIIGLSNSNLQVTEGLGAPFTLTDNTVQISNLQFTNVSQSGTPGGMRISFTISRANPGGRNAYDYTKTFTTTASRRAP